MHYYHNTCNCRIKKEVGNPITVPMIPGWVAYVRMRHGASVQIIRTVNCVNSNTTMISRICDIRIVGGPEIIAAYLLQDSGRLVYNTNNNNNNNDNNNSTGNSNNKAIEQWK